MYPEDNANPIISDNEDSDDAGSEGDKENDDEKERKRKVKWVDEKEKSSNERSTPHAARWMSICG